MCKATKTANETSRTAARDDVVVGLIATIVFVLTVYGAVRLILIAIGVE